MAVQNILVTGGAGYIGSHTIVELIRPNIVVYVIDSLVNSSSESLNRVKTITGVEINFTQLDMCDAIALDSYFQKSPKFAAVIHFAGLKAVGESVLVKLTIFLRIRIDR